ncbi:hypothetical protein M1D53_28955 (plasmid) [Bacillus sp. PK9-021]
MKSKIVPKEVLPSLRWNDFVNYEKDMPFPYVYYPSMLGAFFGFQENEDSPIFHCLCQKKGIEVHLKNIHFRRFDGLPGASQKLLAQTFIDTLQFKENLCHICNKLCPSYGHGKSLGNTKFHSIYGYYINGQAYSYGVEPRGRVYEAELIPADIVPNLITQSYDDRRLDEQSVKDFMRYCEDVIRIRMGYHAIGKKWTTEIKLLELVRKIYPKYTVIHQYELDHLRGDIYIEELKLVIEYQGQQHFKPVSYMDGEEGFKRIQARDKEKVELCNYYKLGILYFSYKDKLSEKLVKDRISSYFKSEKFTFKI